MILCAATASVIVAKTWAAYGAGLTDEVALGLIVTIIDNYCLKGFDHIKEEYAKKKAAK